MIKCKTNLTPTVFILHGFELNIFEHAFLVDVKLIQEYQITKMTVHFTQQHFIALQGKRHLFKVICFTIK